MNKSLVVILIFVALGCDPVDDKLKVVNTTTNSLFYTIGCRLELTEFTEGEESLARSKDVFRSYLDSIGPKSIKKEIIIGNDGAWEAHIKQNCPDQKLILFVFDIDTLKKYNWEEIEQNKLYREKVALSLNDLDRMQWKVDLSNR